MTSSGVTKFKTGHENLVHGIEYDYYGKRLISYSSDQLLKVWECVGSGSNPIWELNDTWKGHDASVVKATWAPPEYGQIIASCSFDRTIKIWEEQPVESKNSQRRWYERFRLVESKGAVMDIAFSPVSSALRLASCSADGMVRIYECLEPTNLTQWSQMEEFAIDMGQGSTSSSLGTLPLNSMIPTSSLLSQQQLLQQHQLQEQQLLRQLQHQKNGNAQHQHQQNQDSWQQQASSPQSQQKKDANAKGALASSSSERDPDLAASPSRPKSGTRSQPPHLGTLGSPPTATTILQQYQQQQQQLSLKTPGSNSSGASSTMEHPQLPFGTHVPSTPALPLAPTLSPRTLPDVAAGVSLSSLNQYHQQQIDLHHHSTMESGFCIDWCPNQTPTAMMVVGLGKEHAAKVFKHDGHNQWQPGEILFGHTSQINDVSWAPSMGRTFQLIATACKDHFVRIFKLTLPNKGDGLRVNMPNTQGNNGTYHVEMMAEFGQHQTEVWRVEWNIMGTILSSSDRDGSLRLWKVGADGTWCEMATLTTSSQQK